MSGEQRTVIKGNASKYVKLNVGGSLFYTTIGTLTKHDNMLRAMFSGRMEVLTDSEGEYLAGKKVCVETSISYYNISGSYNSNLLTVTLTVHFVLLLKSQTSGILGLLQSGCRGCWQPVIMDSTGDFPRWVCCRPTCATKPYASWPGWCVNYGQNVKYSISVLRAKWGLQTNEVGPCTGVGGPTEMII